MATSFERVICFVADGFGVGAAPDADQYGDVGSNTLGNIDKNLGGVKLPNLEKLGMGHLGSFKGISKVASPKGFISKCAELSKGKDTATGHWEIAGIISKEALSVYPQGFPKDMLEEFCSAAKVSGVLANCTASGTEIIKEHGEEHLRTKKPILYTSADSVFQIAAHEEVFGLDRLYEVCKIARELTRKYFIGRVIARPFTGNSVSTFKRTENRRDYTLTPPENALDLIYKEDIEILSVGKIEDIFDHRSITCGNHTGNNKDSLKVSLDFFEKSKNKKSFLFTNLVDFDQLYGHRRDPKGYANALVEMDSFLPKLFSQMTEKDLFLLTADHGCDPTFKGTDHTREYIPIVGYSPALAGKVFAPRKSFSDIGATFLEAFQISSNLEGQSFLKEIHAGS
jgi:phosphopentomutase